MAVTDTFPHTARWDSVGLDCAFCLHFVGPGSWPDGQRVSRCTLHDLSLDIELAPNGYKEGEWFCRDFTAGPDGRASMHAIAHLNRVRANLRPRVLYGFNGPDGTLKEHDFQELRALANRAGAADAERRRD